MWLYHGSNHHFINRYITIINHYYWYIIPLLLVLTTNHGINHLLIPSIIKSIKIYGKNPLKTSNHHFIGVFPAQTQPKRSPGAGNPPSSRRPCWLRLAGPAMAGETVKPREYEWFTVGKCWFLPWKMWFLPWKMCFFTMENVVFTMEHVVLIMKKADVSMVSTGIIPIWSHRNEVVNTI